MSEIINTYIYTVRKKITIQKSRSRITSIGGTEGRLLMKKEEGVAREEGERGRGRQKWEDRGCILHGALRPDAFRSFTRICISFDSETVP